MGRCYHASKTKGLKLINPHNSTHEKAYVYAVKNKLYALLFMSGLGGDLTCSIFEDTTLKRPAVCERFKGALDLRFRHVTGSIYTLDDSTFLENQTQWHEEIVSEKKCAVIHEMVIEDLYDTLIELEVLGELKIFRYPERPSEIPEDDGDLVMRGKRWYQTFGDKIIEDFNKYHPNLVSSIFEERE